MRVRKMRIDGPADTAPVDRPALSEREIEVLRLCADGLGRVEVAEKLGVAKSTVETFLSRARGKLRARNNTHAIILFAVRWDLERTSTVAWSGTSKP